MRCNGAADLGEADGKDGVRAAAGVVHARAARAAVGVALRHQLLHVVVVGDRAFGQICTQGSARPVSVRWFASLQQPYSQRRGRPAGAPALAILRPRLQTSF